jgi:hypothetical protein
MISRALLTLITAIYVLRMAAMLAVTPIGEGLDFFGHLAYLVFLVEQGRPPSPDEASIPDWIERLAQRVPGPDWSTDGRDYRTWAAQPLAARAEARMALDHDTATAAYVSANNQGQHPPLYYGLLGGVYAALPTEVGLAVRVYWLGLVSVIISAMAFPGLFQTLRLHLDETTALLALLGLAWYPNLSPFLARITNDAVAMPLVVWGLYFCLRARSEPSLKHIVAAGLLLGLAGFAKTYSLTLWPVYGLCAASVLRRPRGWRHALLAGLIGVVALGLFSAFNLATTGYLVPLTEMRLTAALPLTVRLAALAQVNPIWFLGGLAKGFWWCGYWSFISPSWLFFLPLVTPAALWLRPPCTGSDGRWGLGLRGLWPHYAAVGCFGLGMLWHAALFTLEARLSGQTRHSGNEGWYANILLGSVTVVACVILRSRLSPAGFRRALAAAVILLIAWGAWAMGTVGAYWGGVVEVQGRLRAVPFGQLLPAMLQPQMWSNWLSLPGVVQPVWLTAVVPLGLALAGTAVVLRRLAAGPAGTGRQTTDRRPRTTRDV